MGRKLYDVDGQRFGKLVVQHRVPNDGEAKWLCLCDCGQTTVAGGHNLRIGMTKSCGCLRSVPYRRIPLTGRRFGRLMVVGPEPRRPGRGNLWWSCKCDCGADKSVRSDRLLAGETISCGCAVEGCRVAARPKAVRDRSAEKDRRRRVDGRVTAEQISALFVLQHGRCANCSIDIADGYHKDHVIPISRGGLNFIENIQLLCVPCNRRKYNKMPWEFALEQGRLV